MTTPFAWDAQDAATSPTPHIVVVCTGNICRSPVGELLLQRHLGDAATVTSAGTHAMVGHGIPDLMMVRLLQHGVDGTAHRAQQLTGALIGEADLIVAMAAEHRKWILREHPGALRRTYLLAELDAARQAGAALTGTTVRERLASLADAVSAVRPEMAGMSMGDVPDPYRRSDAEYGASYALIAELSAHVGPWLAGR